MKKMFSVLLVILVFAGCAFVFAGCGTGERQPDGEEVVSIHFAFWSGPPPRDVYHKYYDFSEMTYSTQIVRTDKNGVGEQEEYAVAATFTEEQATAFFKSIKELGFFELEEKYINNGVFDGVVWHLTITFADGTTFESGGYEKYPEKAAAINEAFL
ncbi:MAG: hypothetical protein FWD39_01750 [Clostridiales bacterium]|nr:hypothetical protein [Clostridiales bacterium]